MRMKNKIARLHRVRAFTLAEVLITLSVIGIVAALTMPTLLTNIQERVRKEQVRTVKYKLTKATEKMNSLGKIGAYPTTMDFVNELKKHLAIAKICDSNELDKCWPAPEINAFSGSWNTVTTATYTVKNLKKGTDLKALAIGTRDTETVGIITGDGVPMLLVYSPVCTGFDEAKTYTWSVEDGKPVTNATTNCISAIFDLNGAKGPNKIGTDVRTLNSVFGSVNLGKAFSPVGVDTCKKLKKKYSIRYCNGEYTISGNDRWVGAIAACDNLGLHLVSLQTLAVLATSRYADPTIGPYTVLFDESFGDCLEWLRTNWGYGKDFYSSEFDVRCHATGMDISDEEAKSAYKIGNGGFWTDLEISDTRAYERAFYSTNTHLFRYPRSYYNSEALCVGD